MKELFLVRLFAYTALPLLLAAGHLFLDRKAQTPARRIELLMLYLFAISIGANGLGGAFGHLFLSDLVAESIGWQAGSPFQLEMGFANLALGVLGLMAISRRDGFRTATIFATAVIGFGATAVHLMDIVESGNLAPGNTLQNLANVVDPLLLIALAWLALRLDDPDAESTEFLRWQARQQPIMGMAAAGIGAGFGVGYATGILWLGTLAGALLGVSAGILLSNRVAGRPWVSADQPRG